MVVGTQTNHTCHITQLNWEIIFSLLRFFPHWAHADSSFVGGWVTWADYTVPYKLYFWHARLRPDARRVIGPDHWVRFWGGELTTLSGYKVAGLPHHHFSAGLHSYVGAWYWADQTHQNSYVTFWNSGRETHSFVNHPAIQAGSLPVSQVANLPGYYKIPNKTWDPSLIAHNFSNVLSTMRT